MEFIFPYSWDLHNIKYALKQCAGSAGKQDKLILFILTEKVYLQPLINTMVAGDKE